MFAKLILLSSLVLFNVHSYAEEEANISFSGFIYNTTFSQKTFHDNRTIAAVNIDADYNRLAIRAQLGTYKDNPVRRAVVEYSLPIGEYTSLITQVGRFGRVDSFSNGVLDTPAASQMAILPFAGYSYRMFNGAFVILDGVQMALAHRTADASIITVRAAKGRMFINSQSDFQLEAFRRYDPLIEIKGTNDSYDIGLHYETKDWHLFVSQNYYQANTSTSSSSLKYRAMADRFYDMEYTLRKYGIKYDNQSYFIRTEYSHGDTYILNRYNVQTAEVVADDYNYVIGKYLGEYTAHFGQSIGFNKTANTSNRDNFAGVTRNFQALTVSLDYHRGEGTGWMKFNSGENRWSSWVISTTIRF